MTANLVTGLSPMQELKTSTAANVNPASGTDFSDVLKNSTGKDSSVNEPVKAPVKDKTQGDKQDKDLKDVDESKADEAVKSDKPEKVNKSDKTEKDQNVEDKDVNAYKDEEPISEEAMEEIAEAVASMVTTIAEVLEIPVEDVTEAIENLGLKDIEILNPGTIPNLVVELTDAADVTEIMTDEELFADVKQIMDTVETTLADVADTLQIPVEDLKSQIGKEVAWLKEQDTKTEDIPTEEIDVKAPELKVTDEVSKPVADQVTERKPTERLSVENETDPQVKADDHEEIAPVSARHEEEKGQDTKNGEDHKSSDHLSFTQTVTDTLKGMVAERVQEGTPTYSTTAEQIMDQVRESLRMTMTEDITEMEMNLHPASLGNVRVQVAAKDGVITASFTTQNEQVKEVLEAQIIQLKDQMNEQGIKIEAVEVTVSAHAFERNLNEGGEERGGQSEAEAKKKKVRGINLTDADLSDLEDLDEEDKVTADMMARQGNTVDYMA